MSRWSATDAQRFAIVPNMAFARVRINSSSAEREPPTVVTGRNPDRSRSGHDPSLFDLARALSGIMPLEDAAMRTHDLQQEVVAVRREAEERFREHEVRTDAL